MNRNFSGRVYAAIALMCVSLADSASSNAAKNQPPAQVPELVAGNTAFAFDLYGDLIKSRAGENLVFSPYSTTLALAMTYAGAAGATAKEMERVLHFAMPADEVHRAFAALQARQKAVFAPKGYELNVANGLWGQKGFSFHASYFTLTRDTYGAALEEIDFRADPEKARQRINAWIAQHTKNKITDLLTRGAIDEETRLVLANAVYLKGAWAKQFSQKQTRKDFFRVDADTKTPILMMSQRGNFRHFEDDDLQAIDLPIGTGGVSMFILLPKHVDGLAKLERTLSHERLLRIRMHMNDEAVTVELPKFKIESDLNLTKSLGALSMSSAFDMQKANFSKMAAKPGIVLNAVAHKAYLSVDETGLEAAAATAVVGKAGAPPPPKLVFRADHPFFYVIRESSSGSILFMGRVFDPGSNVKVGNLLPAWRTGDIPEEAKAYPTASGKQAAQPNRDPMVTTLRFADWNYEYAIANFGTKSQMTWGSLSCAGKLLGAKSMPNLRGNDYLHTPWGTLYWWGERGVTFSHHGWLAHPNPYAKTTGKRLAPPDATPGRVLVAAADHGTTVALAPGDQLVVRLATLGLEDRSWGVVSGSPMILQSMAAPPEMPLYMPGWESLHRQIFYFRAANTGKTTLVLRHGGASGKEWKINVEVNEK